MVELVSPSSAGKRPDSGNINDIIRALKASDDNTAAAAFNNVRSEMKPTPADNHRDSSLHLSGRMREHLCTRFSPSKADQSEGHEPGFTLGHAAAKLTCKRRAETAYFSDVLTDDEETGRSSVM